MIVAYADPPYPGQAAKHYKDHPDYAGEVAHDDLLWRLRATYEHWALSTASTTLQSVLRLPSCPDDVRIGAWVKPFAAFKVNVNPAYAWEPVVFVGGRRKPRSENTVRDWVSTPITLQRGTDGAKPQAFCFWLFDLMGMRPDDTLVDLFPGSGAVTQAWERWQSQWREPIYGDEQQAPMEVA
jgi:hypothetical protein